MKNFIYDLKCVPFKTRISGIICTTTDLAHSSWNYKYSCCHKGCPNIFADCWGQKITECETSSFYQH